MDDSKFLNEENIVKKGPPVTARAVEDQVPPESELEEDVVLPPPRPAVKAAKQAKTPVKRPASPKDKPKPKGVPTRAEVLEDLLQKTVIQKVAKEVEIEVYHRLYRDAGTTEERQRFERTYESFGADIKFLNKKLAVIKEMLVEKGGAGSGRG